MRYHVAVVSLALAASTLGAQTSPNFQGVVHFNVESNGTRTELLYMVRGAKVRTEMSIHGARIVMLTDVSAGETMIVDEQHKVYRVFSAADVPDAAPPTFTRLGTKDHVAGHDCEYFRIRSEDGINADICAASGLGLFVGSRDMAWAPNSSAMRALAAKSPDFARVMREGFLPLKVKSAMPDGSRPTTMTATNIEAKAVDVSLVTLPAGYTKIEMPTMSGRGSGRP
jgi:hypothetical protein